MAIELVTGHAGEGHVSSADAGRFNAGVCGPEKYVLNTGLKFAASIESANLVRITSGDAINQGRHITIPQNTYEDASILNGTVGKTRIDVIALRYTKATRQVEGEAVTVEEASVVVIKGTEVNTGTTPEVPAVISGNIFSGESTDDMPLYHVLITDTSIESVTPVFKVMPNLIGNVQMQNQINTNAGNISSLKTRATNLETRATTAETNISSLKTRATNLETRATTTENKIGTVSMGTTATTLTGAIKELVSKIGSSTMNTSATTLTGAIREIMGIIGTATMSTSATTIKGAVNELLNGINSLKTRATNLEGRVGSATLNTESVTCTWAINELLVYINNLKTRATNLETRATNLETHDTAQGIKCVSFSYGNLQFDSSGAINSVKDFSSVVPSGYTAIAAIPFASGSYAAYFYSCGLETSKTCRIRLFRGEWTSVTQTNPSIVLICKRNL